MKLNVHYRHQIMSDNEIFEGAAAPALHTRLGTSVPDVAETLSDDTLHVAFSRWC